MAAVFPSIASSGNNTMPSDKSMIASTSQRNEKLGEGISGYVSKIFKNSSVITATESLITHDHDYEKVNDQNCKSSNRLSLLEIRQNNLLSVTHVDQDRSDAMETVIGKPSSIFQKTIVQAMAEKPKLGARNGNVERIVQNSTSLSDNSFKLALELKSSEKGCNSTVSCHSKSTTQFVNSLPYSPLKFSYTKMQPVTTATKTEVRRATTEIETTPTTTKIETTPTTTEIETTPTTTKIETTPTTTKIETTPTTTKIETTPTTTEIETTPTTTKIETPTTTTEIETTPTTTKIETTTTTTEIETTPTTTEIETTPTTTKIETPTTTTKIETTPTTTKIDSDQGDLSLSQSAVINNWSPNGGYRMYDKTNDVAIGETTIDAAIGDAYDLHASINTDSSEVALSSQMKASINTDSSEVALSSQRKASINTDSSEAALSSQRNTSNVLVNSDDTITTYGVVATESLQPAQGVKVTVSTKDCQRPARKRLSTRISKRFVRFFLKRSGSNSTILNSTKTSRPNCCANVAVLERTTDLDLRTKYATLEKTAEKDMIRQTSLVGKLVTSVIKWRRKPANVVNSSYRGQQQHRNDSDIEDKNDTQNSNNRRIPIFVSAQDQAEIVEDAPPAIIEDQKHVLRESWSLIKTDIEDVGVEAFMGLFHTHPDSIDSFLAFKDKSIDDIEQSAVLKAHALRVMQTVDKCITRLDDIDKMASVLCQLGRRHVGYQANVSLIPMIGKQFISAIEPKMADKWSEKVQTAWDAMFQTINYNMRQGMMQEKHRLHDVTTTRK